MNTTVTPPAPPAPASEPPAPPTRPSTAARVVAILVIVFGAVALVGGLGSAALSTLSAASVRTTSQTASAAGVTALTADVSAGSLRVEFADVRQAELDVTAPWGAATWSIRNVDGTLHVDSNREDIVSWWGFGGWGDAVLRLPERLDGMDLDIVLSAGSITADGEFADVDIEVGAGSAELSGSAQTLVVDLSAGGAQLDLADVRTADLTVSAGSLDAVLTGTAPRELNLEVSAGGMNLTVPDARYDITSEVSAGEFDSRIESTAGAPNTIDANVSAGQLVLRSR